MNQNNDGDAFPLPPAALNIPIPYEAPYVPVSCGAAPLPTPCEVPPLPTLRSRWRGNHTEEGERLPPGHILRDRFNGSRLWRVWARVYTLLGLVYHWVYIHGARNLKWTIDRIDRTLPASWNPKNRETGGDTRFRQAVNVIYFERYRYTRNLLIFLAVVIVVFLAGQYTMSMVPWYLLRQAPIVVLQDRNGNVKEFYRPNRIYGDIHPYTSLYKHKGHSIRAEDIDAGTMVLSVHPPLFYGYNSITISFDVLVSKMMSDLMFAFAENSPLSPESPEPPFTILKEVREWGDDGVGCAIEYQMPINMIVILPSDRSSDVSERTLVMFEPELKNVIRDKHGPPTRPLTATTLRDPLSTPQTRYTPVKEWKPYHVESMVKGSVSYTTRHGTKAKQVLEGHVLDHVAFCIRWLSASP